MGIKSYFHRLSVSMLNGVMIGIHSALLASLGYILVFSGLFMVMMNIPQFNLGLDTQPITVFGHSFVIALALAVFMLVIGAIPAMLIGAIGGGVIGFVLSLWGKKLSNLSTVFVGLVVGIGLVFSANYLYWLSRVTAPPFYGDHMTFYEYLFSVKFSSFSTFIMSPNWYFMPSIIAIIISPYIGWKINTVDVLMPMKLAFKERGFFFR